MAPAVGIVLFIPVVTAYAGAAAPFAYLVATLIVALVGIVLTQLAKHLPSAGGYYTYLSRTVGGRAGFLTAWAMFIFELLGPAAALAYGGFLVESTLKAEYDVTFRWWWFMLLGAALLFVLVYFGLRVSVKAIAALCTFELVAVLALSVWGLAAPGPGGFSLAPFNPASAPSGNGLYLGVVFTILAIAGFDSIVPLAEEADRPRAVVPRAILLAIGISGAYLVIASWGIVVAWGTADISHLASSSENPVFVIAHHLWRGAWVVIFVAIVNSVLGISIASQNAATRVLYAMGRSGALPAFLGRVRAASGAPVGALYLQTAITLAVGLGAGAALGPLNLFVATGLAFTLGLIVMYIAGNVGAFLLYTRERRAEFNPVLHALVPLVASLALVWVGYKSLDPLPSGPAHWAPFGVLAWFAVGVATLVVMHVRGREQWLAEAGAVMAAGDGDARADDRTAAEALA